MPAPAPLRPVTTHVVMVDVVESTHRMAVDEPRMVHEVRGLLLHLADQARSRFGAWVVERQGDGLLLQFDQARAALQWASAVQRAPRPVGADVALRVGLHHAELLSDGQALYGHGLNLLARLTAIGEPGDVVLSAPVRDSLSEGIDAHFEDLGECHLKHIPEPVRLFRLSRAGPASLAGLDDAIRYRMSLRPTLVVLPAQVHGPAAGAAGAQALAEILTDQFIRALSRSRMLHVISPLSARALRGSDLTRQDVLRRWHAAYGVELQLHTKADALPQDPAEVALTLWKTGLGEPVWQGRSRARAQDALREDGDLVAPMAQAVAKRVLKVEQLGVAPGVRLPNLASHTLYLNAVDLLHRFTLTDFQRALPLLEALSERAPREAEPLAWMARWHVFRVVQGWSDDQARDGHLALDCSARALERDPASAVALTMAGSVTAGILRDPQGAQTYYEQALQANPNEPLAWLMRGVAHGFTDEPAPALAASETALGLAPVDPMRHYYDSLAASAAVMAGETARGIGLARRAIHANACHGSAYRALAAGLVEIGQMAEARVTVQRLLAIEPQCTVRTFLGRAGASNRRVAELAAHLESAGLPPH